jgi:putative transposase
MIDLEHDLPISRQAKVLNISRGLACCRLRPISPKDLAFRACRRR